MQRPFLIVVAVLAAALFGWLLLADDSAPSGVAKPKPPRPEVAATARPQGDVAKPAAVAAADRSEVKDRKDKTATSPPAGAGRTLRGTFAVVDERGVRHEHEDGRMRLTVWRGDIGRGAEVAIAGGRWEVHLDQAKAVSVDNAELGTRAVRATTARTVLPEDDPGFELALEGTWLPAVRLRVLGADTGGDLSGVKVVHVLGGFGDSFRHPSRAGGEVRVLVDGARSPLEVPIPAELARWQETTYWIDAPGYGWERVKVVQGESRERVVTLQPGGSLEVTVHGGGVPKRSMVRVRESKEQYSRVVGEFALRGGKTQIGGLAAGRYDVRVEKGNWFDHPLVLGHAEATVVAGQSTPVSIALVEDVPPPKVTLAGSLRLGEGWDPGKVRLKLAPGRDLAARLEKPLWLKPSAMNKVDEREWQWDAGEVLAGRYDVSIPLAQIRCVIDTGPRGRRDVLLDVPAAASVELHLIDGESGRAAKVDSVSWRSATPPGWSSAWGLGSARRDDGGVWRFAAPPGKATVNTFSKTYGWTEDDCEIAPGRTRLVVQVTRACGVTVKLVDGGVEVPWDDSYWVDAKAVDGGGHVRTRSGPKATVTGPGRYRVEVSGVRGFADPAPQTVDLEPGTYVGVVFALRRPAPR